MALISLPRKLLSDIAVWVVVHIVCKILWHGSHLAAERPQTLCEDSCFSYCTDYERIKCLVKKCALLKCSQTTWQE